MRRRRRRRRKKRRKMASARIHLSCPAGHSDGLARPLGRSALGVSRGSCPLGDHYWGLGGERARLPPRSCEARDATHARGWPLCARLGRHFLPAHTCRRPATLGRLFSPPAPLPAANAAQLCERGLCLACSSPSRPPQLSPAELLAARSSPAARVARHFRRQTRCAQGGPAGNKLRPTWRSS